MDSTALPARPAVSLIPARGRVLAGIATGGAAVSLAGALLAPERLWPALLVAAFYVLGVGLGGVLFLVFTQLARGAWARSLTPLPAALAATVPVGAALMAVTFAGLPWLYDWVGRPLSGGKGAWLAPLPFLVRAAFCLAVWTLFARRIVSLARSGASRTRTLRTACGFLVLFAATFSVASFDWIMSREPHWYSTVFAIYTFTGTFVAGLAAITVMAVRLRRQGAGAAVAGRDQLHDLGQLLLGFTTFWAYIWFCQHMLIWYAHLPEETAYYVRRFEGAWGPLMVLNLAVNWLIPFLVLLPRPAKRRESTMLGVALLLLAGHALDLYLLVQPASLEHGPVLGLWEIAPLALAGALFLLALGRAFRRGVPGRILDGRP